MSGAPRLTTVARLGAGAELRRGTRVPYLAVSLLPGEPHRLRRHPAAEGSADARDGRPLAVLAHVTDLQLADVASPARFEFLNRGARDPRYAKIVPVQRPQEALTPHAVSSVVETLNRLAHAPVSGAPLDLVVTTGDSIDNAQWNELRALLALLDGGRVSFGDRPYQGVQRPDWPDDIFWIPDGRPGDADVFTDVLGYPTVPGLLDRALTALDSPGLVPPWLACYGNHEALNQGVGPATPALQDALTGGRKPTALPWGFDEDEVYEVFARRPEELFLGPAVDVDADADRRMIDWREFVSAHLHASARPVGHGFTEQNAADGTAYYVHDLPEVRVIALDTACVEGGADGCVDAAQARWLRERLAEVHGRYVDERGEVVRTASSDRLVVVMSHHGSSTLTGECGHAGEPGLSADGLRELLHRFPNVVLWLNGHTHTNSVQLRESGASGFWEVTTCSISDWPSQFRLVELLACPDGTVSIACTMVDHGAPLSPGEVLTTAEMAALHREVAGNAGGKGFGSPLEGEADDRNVDLRLPAPFPLAAGP